MKLLKKIKHEMNYLKLSDLSGVFIFIVSIIPSLLYLIATKISKKRVWLICEDENGARDNGYCFYKYLCENTDEMVIYAINRKSPDYKKVKSLGKTVQYGSVMHWMYYFACEYNISTQKAGKPNAAIGYVLDRIGVFQEKFIFLQHGITINKAEWLFYENTKMRLFICGARPEYEYVKQCFGYPEKNVEYLGFSRFDDYYNAKVKTSQLLLMPSWREWIGSKNEYSKEYGSGKNFVETEYYERYQSLINNSELKNFLKENNLELYFYPHRNMQKFISCFNSDCENIKIVDSNNSDIRELLIESALMITDYSSVALDFAYMKKPVLFYQFDEERFRQAQYAEGYFDYQKCGLGKVVKSEQQVVEFVKEQYNSHYNIDKDYIIAHKKFFPLCDNSNCTRIYKCLKNMRC